MARRYAPFIPQRRRRSPIQGAASSVVEGGNPANPDAIVARADEWQRRANKLIGAIPEASASASYVNNSLRRVEFRADGITDPTVRATVNNQLRTLDVGRIAENLFRIGEGVIAYEYSAQAGRTKWWDYSIFEYEATDKKAPRVKRRNGKWEDLPAERKSFRVWRPDSDERFEAHSNHRALLDVMEALFIHQLADSAVATSRLAGAGVLWFPNDELPDAPMDSDTPEPGSQQDVARQLALAMTQSVKDRNIADAIVPYLYFGKAEHAAGLRHLLMERQDDAKAFATRMETYRRRYAGGIDLPAEVVLGLADANHWTAWKVDENTWTYYLAPLAQMIAQAIERNFVEPVARNLGYMGATTVVPDGSEVIAKPDRTEAGIRLRSSGTITREAAAREAGFNPEDVETGPDPILDPIAGAGDADPLPVADSEQPPIAAALSPEQALGRVSRELMALEAGTHLRYQQMLLTRVPAYLKAQQRVRRQAASLDPEAELLAIAQQSSAITRRALEQRIRILSRATGADADSLLRRYEAIIDRRAQAVAQASTAYATHVAQSQSIQRAAEEGKPLGRFEQIRLTPATVGGLTSIMNGGREAHSPDYLRLEERPTDFSNDEIVRDTLVDAGLDYQAKYRWTRGNPENPFEPHLDLDGREWTNFADATFLDNAHLGFNPAGIWYPNDHVGCQCEYEITLEPAAAARS